MKSTADWRVGITMSRASAVTAVAVLFTAPVVLIDWTFETKC